MENRFMDILVKCFKNLPRRDLQRFKFHVEAKTPICCGVEAHIYTDGKGGG